MDLNGEHWRVVTTCYLVRHGQIQANVDRLWHGTTDSELTDLGQRQIRDVGLRFGDNNSYISAIYSSPLKRTMKTAGAISKALSQVVEPIQGLIEYGIGDWEGLSYETLGQKHDFYGKIAQDQDYQPEGGESVNQVSERMISAFYGLVEQHRGQNIVLVGHGAAFAILMATLLDGSGFPFYDHHMSNTGVTTLEVTPDNAVSRPLFDCTLHLKSA